MKELARKRELWNEARKEGKESAGRKERNVAKSNLVYGISQRISDMNSLLIATS